MVCLFAVFCVCNQELVHRFIHSIFLVSTASFDCFLDLLDSEFGEVVILLLGLAHVVSLMLTFVLFRSLLVVVRKSILVCYWRPPFQCRELCINIEDN